LTSFIIWDCGAPCLAPCVINVTRVE
jgi:hypothetical protein